MKHDDINNFILNNSIVFQKETLKYQGVRVTIVAYPRRSRDHLYAIAQHGVGSEIRSL